MNHAHARHRLSALLDGTLPAALEERVRAHVETCPRCGAALADYEAADLLLLRLPLALVPREPCARADARLAGLARWGAIRAPSRLERMSEHVLSAVAAAALIALIVGIGEWAPVVESPPDYRTYAALIPETPLTPIGWR